MATIPQRELRNNVSDVLRRAEGGERITVTVNGRPVAEVGPLESRQFAPMGALKKILEEAPADPTWAEDLRRMRDEDLDSADDPWAD